ncbi:MAG: acyl-CoA dehydrogenase family protein, partial [Myxococcales bacterium]|nr:acyl-CoA dehydrogenase family protein [Myxococcales bacterium]
MKRSLLSEEHRIFEKAFRTFVEREVLPKQSSWAERGMVDRETWLAAGAGGFLCPWLEEEHGGAGGDFIHSAIA